MMKMTNILLYILLTVFVIQSRFSLSQNSFICLQIRLQLFHTIYSVLKMHRSIWICMLIFRVVSWSGTGGKCSYLKRLITIMQAYCVSRQFNNPSLCYLQFYTLHNTTYKLVQTYNHFTFRIYVSLLSFGRYLFNINTFLYLATTIVHI